MYKVFCSPIFHIANCISKIFLELFVFDRQIRRILKGKFAKLYLQKYVRKANKIYVPNKDKTKPSHIIWQYWEQGLENAPDIVKQCVASVEKYKTRNKHIILDKNTISDYLTIPDFISKMNEKGIIKSAHFSDYVRTALLAEYGGTWIDATVLLSDNLPKYVTNADLFVFQNELRNDLDGLNFANYFISAKPHNEIIEKMKLILEMYWKENNFVNNYFFYLHAFTLLSQSTKELMAQFAKIPFFSFIPVQRFQGELLTPFSEERWKQIKSMSFAHKLSYKVNVLSKHKPIMAKGTFYEKLYDGELIAEPKTVSEPNEKSQ